MGFEFLKLIGTWNNSTTAVTLVINHADCNEIVKGHWIFGQVSSEVCFVYR